jgi:hypothetical protein
MCHPAPGYPLGSLKNKNRPVKNKKINPNILFFKAGHPYRSFLVSPLHVTSMGPASIVIWDGHTWWRPLGHFNQWDFQMDPGLSFFFFSLLLMSFSFFYL